MELNPYSETHSTEQIVSHLSETWLYFFASPHPHPHTPPSQEPITESHLEQSETVLTVPPYIFKILLIMILYPHLGLSTCIFV